MDRGLLADFKLLWLLSQQLSKADKMNLVMTVEGHKGHRPLSPAHTSERATPILGLCHGVFHGPVYFEIHFRAL